MHPTKKAMLWINLLGGVAVLGSYFQGIATHPGEGDVLWGGVPDDIRPLYAVGMLLAALGYFAFTYFLLIRLDPSSARIGGRLGFGAFNWLYLGILLPSALWMPLTWLMVEQPAPALWLAVRIVLVLVALASLGILLGLWWVRPKEPIWSHRLAVVGSAVFFAHTGVLDALIWPILFPA